MHKFIFLVLFALISCAGAQNVDLREYFPSTYGQTKLDRADGSSHARYTFTSEHPGFTSLYNNLFNQNKPGKHYVWQKEYWKNGAWCTSTYAILFMGDDLSVTEVGDWLASTPCTPNVAFGYKKNNVPAGIEWSPAGGLTGIPQSVEVDVARQLTPGSAYQTYGSKAYSRTGLIEHFDEFTTAGGVFFTDVVHIVMYHGTKNTSSTVVRCTPPLVADGVYYQSYKDYNSYAMELWLAKGVGVIQERTPFIEDGTYWGFKNCWGDLFNQPPTTTYTSVTANYAN